LLETKPGELGLACEMFSSQDPSGIAPLSVLFACRKTLDKNVSVADLSSMFFKRNVAANTESLEEYFFTFFSISKAPILGLSRRFLRPDRIRLG
jgi:hypothetical protein